MFIPCCVRRFSVVQGTLVFLLSCLLHAQTPGTGAIAGAVTDPTGAVLTNASVEAVSQETNWSRTTRTTTDGLFRLTVLPPGAYSVIVSAPGFQTKQVDSIHVVAGETALVTVRLVVGTVTSETSVVTTPEFAQAESSVLGSVTDTRTITALPLANRNFSQILALSPGVVVDVPNAAALGKNTQNVSSNGAKTTANNFQFNGIDANNLSQGSFSGFDPEPGIAIPAPDTIAEFKVQTGMYDAGYGRSAGANVDFISRTGTNRFHGSLWEFFRNDVLNANDFFLKQSGQDRPVLKQNQFGGEVGGPIRKGKTFFFGSYQATTQRDGGAPGSLAFSFLPILPKDRSAPSLGAAFCPANNPFFKTAAGGVQVACDGSNINPVALALLNYKFPNQTYAIPSPQINGNMGVGTSTFSSPAKYREDQFSVNLDHRISDPNQLSGRFFFSRATTNEPFTPFGGNLPGWGTDETQTNDMFVLSDTHTFNPRLINVARFGFMRFNGFMAGQVPIKAADVGMTTGLGVPGIPSLSVAGLFTIGPAGGQPFYYENTNTFVWQDTVSLTRGRHNLRMGGEAKRHQVAINPPFVTNGFMFFFTFADFLLGEDGVQNGTGQSNIFNSVGASGIFRKDERYRDYAGFVQDDIKVSPRLTVNAGLRYEFFGPPSDVHGHLSNFDPSLAPPQVPASGSLLGFILPSNFRGPIAPGVTQTSISGMWNSDYGDWSPRAGFALRLHNAPTVVLRGGYGIYYQRLTGQLAFDNIGQQPFAVTQSLQGVGNSAATFQQPFTPPLPPTSAYPIYSPRTPDSALFLSSIGRHLTSPYAQQYDLNIQYEVSRDLLWEVGYVGSKATHLTGCVEFNQALIATPQNPVNGQTTTTVENLAQRVPFAGIASGSYMCKTGFDGNYNSLQTSLNKRFSHGLDFLASYTFSKNLDYTSGTGGLSSLDLTFLGNDQTKPRQSRGLNDFDRTHRFVLSFVYTPPKLESGPSVLQHVLSHWQFSGQSVLQSGLPITAMDSTAGSVYGNLTGFLRAECTGANPASSGSLVHRLNGYFNPQAFEPPPSIGDGTDFGSCGVGILRGPSQLNLDLGIQRNFPVTEAMGLQFRAELFNFTNTPKFGLPNSDFLGGFNREFGVIASTVANPRIIQFALKFTF
jgi:hypothetical protein